MSDVEITAAPTLSNGQATVIANSVAVARILLTVPLFWLLSNDGGSHRWAALAIFLLGSVAGLIELTRRSRHADAVGGFLAVLADRLLTLTVAAALISVHELGPLGLLAAMLLVASDLTLAGLNETLHTRLDERFGSLERSRLACQFVAFAFLITPDFGLPDTLVRTHEFGEFALLAAVTLALFCLAGDFRRATALFAAKP